MDVGSLIIAIESPSGSQEQATSYKETSMHSPIRGCRPSGILHNSECGFSNIRVTWLPLYYLASCQSRHSFFTPDQLSCVYFPAMSLCFYDGVCATLAGVLVEPNSPPIITRCEYRVIRHDYSLTSSQYLPLAFIDGVSLITSKISLKFTRSTPTGPQIQPGRPEKSDDDRTELRINWFAVPFPVNNTGGARVLGNYGLRNSSFGIMGTTKLEC